ncbi:hypothetical protein Hanom_Chr05g00403891 [Helianthus anomalus]
MCYIQAMPMMWRVLYTIENIIEQEGIEIGMSELASYIILSAMSLDPAVRTFQAKTKDSQEVSSSSVTMSSNYSHLCMIKDLNRRRIRILICYLPFVGAGKSSKSTSRFSVSDLDAFASSRSGKKRLAASPSIPAPKVVSTKGKGGNKRKTADTFEGLPLIQHQFEEYVSKVRIPDP